MGRECPRDSMPIVPNPDPGAPADSPLPASVLEAAIAEVTAWPGYEPTPLRRLRGLEERSGVRAVYYKDEATRFGQGSFKALGAMRGVLQALAEALGMEDDRGALFDGLRDGRLRDRVADVTVSCASEGNHGRGVAWAACELGCEAVVYLSRLASPARAEAIEALGARVVRTDGTFDSAVRACAEASRRSGWYLVSDTAFEGYREIPRAIMAGYSTLMDEVRRQTEQGSGDVPTHVFAQAGVGGLAGALCAYVHESWPGETSRFVVVEPERGGCLFESARAGRMRGLEGPAESDVPGLACADPSTVAWEILRRGASAFALIDDEDAFEAVRVLARLDPPVRTGPAGASGLALLLRAADDSIARRRLGLSAASVVLVVGTEGAHEPVG